MPYSLMSFLLEKKALRNYLDNICEDKFIVFSVCKLKNLPDGMFYCNNIGFAFIWARTKEGPEYWAKLDTEYGQKLNNEYEQKALQQGKL